MGGFYGSAHGSPMGGLSAPYGSGFNAQLSAGAANLLSGRLALMNSLLANGVPGAMGLLAGGVGAAPSAPLSAPDAPAGPGGHFARGNGDAEADASDAAIPTAGVAERLAAACQSTLLGRTLQQFGGMVQVITEATHPYRTLSVSHGWLQLCGYSRDEVLGRSLKFMQGPNTEPDALDALMRGVSLQVPVSVRLTNYTKQGLPFVHQLSCEPLRDPSGEVRCFQASSLVLQPPGEARWTDATDPMARAMPPIHTNAAMPPLWPLLGLGLAGGGCAPAADIGQGSSPQRHPAASAPGLARQGLPAFDAARGVGTHSPAAGGRERAAPLPVGMPPPFPLAPDDGHIGGSSPSDSETDRLQRERQEEIERQVDELDRDDVLTWLNPDDPESLTASLMQV